MNRRRFLSTITAAIGALLGRKAVAKPIPYKDRVYVFHDPQVFHLPAIDLPVPTRSLHEQFLAGRMGPNLGYDWPIGVTFPDRYGKTITVKYPDGFKP